VTLAESQALFFGFLVGSADPDDSALEQCFRGGMDRPASDGLAIYRGMYVARLVDALRETFPNLARFLGEDGFWGLGVDYVARHPSEHHDVGQLGHELPAFLRRHPDPDRPDLADLAELEWARNEVFFAPTTDAVGIDALRSLSPEVATDARLRLAPGLRVLLLAHDAPSLWRKLERREPPDAPEAETTSVAVWRRSFEVFHCVLDRVEAEALRLAAEERTLAEICACFEERPDPVADAFAALSGWLEEGWVVSLKAV